MINLIYAIQNFVLYLTPLFLLMVRVWSENLRIKIYLDILFSPIIVITGTGIFGLLAIFYPIWEKEPIHLFFYMISFLILYNVIWSKYNSVEFFDIFFYAILSLFVISELWELPIIIRSFLTHNIMYNLQHIILISFKLISILILYFYGKQDFKQKMGWDNFVITRFITIPIIILVFVGFFNFWISLKIFLLVTFINIFWSLESK